jgi:hypothetical protein
MNAIGGVGKLGSDEVASACLYETLLVAGRWVRRKGGAHMSFCGSARFLLAGFQSYEEDGEYLLFLSGLCASVRGPGSRRPICDCTVLHFPTRDKWDPRD